jgi:hypothetical protein
VSDERRQSQRYPEPAARAGATLRSRRFGDIPAALINESAGGFLIEVERDLRFRIGAEMKLRTRDGWQDVRVAHRQSEHGRTRIGLQRMGEDKNVKVALRPSHLLYRLSVSHIDPSRAVVPCVNLALASLLVLLLVVGPFGRVDPTEAIGEVSVGMPAGLGRRHTSPEDRAQTRRAVLEAKMNALESLVSSPDVRAALEMTESQGKEIQEILRKCRQSLSDPEMSQSDKLAMVEQAYIEALAKLTPRQQRQVLRGVALGPT